MSFASPLFYFISYRSYSFPTEIQYNNDMVPAEKYICLTLQVNEQ